MTADGFLVAGCDGSVPQGGLWNFLPRPPELAGVRPDACGIAPAPANSRLAKQRPLRTLTHLTLENSFGCLDASCTTRGEWRVVCTLRSPGPLLVFSIACFAKSDCRGHGT